MRARSVSILTLGLRSTKGPEGRLFSFHLKICNILRGLQSVHAPCSLAFKTLDFKSRDMVFRQGEVAGDKTYHTRISAFLYNVLSLTEYMQLCEVSGPLTACLALLLQ